ncbi:MAG TPA: SDR family oxidoreductase [Gammaproteobacteria bacterium]|nr:SDR family oxidoreductase [Gammaproteobacteria bacterium]
MMNSQWIQKFSLENQVAIVTGAAGGLGQQLARILLDAGAKVILTDIDAERLNTISQQLDPSQQHIFVQSCDVTQKQSICNLIEAIEKRFSSVDILINCAGILGNDSLIMEVTEEEWDAVINVNLKGMWLISTAVAKFMMAKSIKGKIVNISSSLGLRSQLGRIPYATSKAGVEHLTRNMAMELVQYDIRVNCLAPGWMNTQMVTDLLNGPEGDKYRKTIPMRRTAEPEELTGALLLLASDASSYMTGTVIRVDGGYAYCGIDD